MPPQQQLAYCVTCKANAVSMPNDGACHAGCVIASGDSSKLIFCHLETGGPLQVLAAQPRPATVPEARRWQVSQSSTSFPAAIRQIWSLPHGKQPTNKLSRSDMSRIHPSLKNRHPKAFEYLGNFVFQFKFYDKLFESIAQVALRVVQEALTLLRGLSAAEHLRELVLDEHLASPAATRLCHVVVGVRPSRQP